MSKGLKIALYLFIGLLALLSVFVAVYYLVPSFRARAGTWGPVSKIRYWWAARQARKAVAEFPSAQNGASA